MSKKMSDEERHNLVLKLDREFQEFVQKKQAEVAEKPKQPKKSFQEELEELSNHPAFIQEFDPSKPMSPAMEALQAIKYESDDDESNADSFKDDGNYNFKKKKYRWAIDSYTKGIVIKCKDRQLNAILYCNRAAAHWHLGNYRSSFRDVVFALKFKPDHMKAIIRGVMCCMEIKRHQEAIQWCDNGLQIDPTEKTLLQLRPKAVSLKAQLEKERRREAAKERKEEAAESELIHLIKSRGVKLASLSKDSESSVLESIEPNSATGAKVFMDAEKVLHWPVFFIYPEYGETDFIQAFNEQHSLADHIESMFGATTEPAAWDKDNKYRPQNIDVYFEDKEKEQLIKLKQSSTLGDILKHDRYIVHSGTPGFILLVRNSDFAKNFCLKYKS